MLLLREVLKNPDDSPAEPPFGWSVGHLANLGVMLSTPGFEIRLDSDELDKFFDAIESGEGGEVRDHDGDIVTVAIEDDQVVLSRPSDYAYPYGVIIDLSTLKEMGIEQYEEQEDDPESEFEVLVDDDTVVTEGVKRAFRRSGKKIKVGFRVTSGYRKGRVVSSAKAAYKPRIKASTRTKLKLASRRKKFVRILKGRITRRKPMSKRLTTLNKRLK